VHGSALFERGETQILGVTTDEKAWRQLNMSWGVTPVLSEEYNSLDIVFYQGMQMAKKIFDLHSGDNVVLTGGLINGTPGNTNVIKVEAVK
jgi:pyruvate kinase